MTFLSTYRALLARLAVGVVLAAAPVQAQETPKPADKPLELPQIVIEGTEKISVPGGVKKTPAISLKLSQTELGALNSLEKYPPALLPAQPLPVMSSKHSLYNGFIQGQFGMYVTPSVMAGYRTEFGGFDIYARGGFEASSGHITNGAYSKGFVNLNAGYLAPEKYWLFGGSKTDSYFRYGGRSYNLYALPEAPERSVREFDLGLTVRGNYEGFGYDAGAGIDNMVLTQDRDVSNNSLFGYVAVNQLWSGFRVGGRLALNFRTLRGTGYNFVEAAATGEYLSEPLLVAADAGVQLGGTSDDESQVAPLLRGRAEFRISKDVTLRGRLAIGLRDRSFRDLLWENPYLDDSSEVRYTGVMPEIGGVLLYHPSVALTLSGGLTMTVLKDRPVYLSTGNGTFRTLYADASILEALGEARIAFDTVNTLIGTLIFRSSALADSGSAVPYVSPVQLGAEYERRWTPEFTTTVSLKYIGQRYADLDNTVSLDGYVDLGLAATYAVSNRFSVFARLNNLAGSKIYIWEGYRERGIFGTAGLTWQF